MVQHYLHEDDQWLDMETGGGELMTEFNHDPQLTSITEGWEPNIRLLREKVVPRGITLYPDHDDKLTKVPNSFFDVVTNSHGALPLARIAGVLKPEGIFITQQVGATNNYSLSRLLSPSYTPAYPDNHLLRVMTDCPDHGLRMLRTEAAFSKITFTDVGAVVYYATVIPWEFPDFDVIRCRPQLEKLQQMITSGLSITSYEDLFLLVAQKQPANK